MKTFVYALILSRNGVADSIWRGMPAPIGWRRSGSWFPRAARAELLLDHLNSRHGFANFVNQPRHGEWFGDKAGDARLF